MADAATIEALKASAQRCRGLADSATDREAAEALRQLASDTEEAISILAGQKRSGSGSVT